DADRGLALQGEVDTDGDDIAPAVGRDRAGGDVAVGAGNEVGQLQAEHAVEHFLGDDTGGAGGGNAQRLAEQRVAAAAVVRDVPAHGRQFGEDRIRAVLVGSAVGRAVH